MTHERQQGHAAAKDSSRDEDDEDLDPGRISRSALMRRPDRAIASGIVQRKARDDNGVADGAEHAVAAASSSSGSPLPSGLMRKFEDALGADLSAVRVHTGESSAFANDAVGAKAYTMGSDIHFGTGHYDPSSPAGEHLLAHEVAHTVQQSGGAQRMQFKLAVSSPGDAMEHEADAAADAMVSGRPASISGGAPALLRKVGSSPGIPDIPPFKYKIKELKTPPKTIGPVEVTGSIAVSFAGSLTKGAGGGTPGMSYENPGDKKSKPGGLSITPKGSSSGPGATLELEKKLDKEFCGFKPSLKGDIDFSSKGITLGVGLELSQAFGPIKVTLVPLHIDLIDWKPGKEPRFGAFSTTIKVGSQDLLYTFSDGRVCRFSFNGVFAVSAAATPTAVAKFLIKRYGATYAATLMEQGIGPAVGGAISLAVGLAPIWIPAIVGAASMATCIQAKTRGDLEGRLLAGARDVQRAALIYALMMTGDTKNAFPASAPAVSGPRTVIATANAVVDLQRIAALHDVTPAEMRRALKDGGAYLPIFKATAGTAYPAYVSSAKDAIKAWRDEKFLGIPINLDSATKTEFVELAEIERKVRDVFTKG